jgi:lisH domain-containing protein FOPNL
MPPAPHAHAHTRHAAGVHRGGSEPESVNAAALREALEQDGALEAVRAQLRAAVFKALHGEREPALAPSAEALLVHELIREYFQFAGYQHSLSVFEAEASLAAAAPPRRVMAERLNLKATPAQVPLIFGMLAETTGFANAEED